MGIPTLASAQNKPVIQRISPPNWWVSFTSPMLLIRGNDLSGAKFSIAAHGVTLTRQQVSANGHWAFLWLDTSHAQPQTIALSARDAAGVTTEKFVLEKPRPESTGFAGFSAKDVMYLIMPDRFADGDTSNDDPPGAEPSSRKLPRGWHGGDLKGI